MTYQVISGVILCLIAATTVNCSSKKLPKTSNQTELYKEKKDSQSVIINCDSVYPGENISIEFLEKNFPREELNATFKVVKNGTILVSDSLFTERFAVEFKDFNGDGIKDILAHNSSDVRSNWTWYLYLADSKAKSFKRIKGFENIKNPNYLEKHDLIDCLVMSGTNWTAFYQIQSDSVHDFGFTVDMDFISETKKYSNYEKDYQAALKKIIRLKK